MRWQSIETSERPLQEAVFSAYLKGNTLWPQAGNGIVYLSLNAILQEVPSVTLNSGFGTNLSDSQLEIAGERLSLIHQGLGIPVGFGDWARVGDSIVHPQELRYTWQEMKDQMVEMLWRYVKSNRSEVNTYDEDKRLFKYPYSEVIRMFLEYQDFQNDRVLVRNGVQFVAQVLLSPQAIGMSKLWRLYFNRNLSREQRYGKAEKISKQYEVTVKGDPLATNYDYAMTKLIRQKVGQEYPDTDMRWLVAK